MFYNIKNSWQIFALTEKNLLNLRHLTVCVFLFICLRLLMSLTFSSCPAMGASNRTYFIYKALISFCRHSIIAHLRAFIHYHNTLSILIIWKRTAFYR
jgi:hypothetical protein